MPARSKRGFTLVELMVALVIAGILVAIIFQFLVGQVRFSRLQTAREEVQQNARIAVDVISSDLRAVGRQGIVAAGSDAIAFRTPRAWGLVCGYSGGSLAVIFPAAAVPALKTGSDQLTIGAATYPVTDVTSDGTNAANVCNTNVKPIPVAAASERRARLYDGAPSGLLPRQDVYVYDQVAYDVGGSTVTGIPGLWIRRNGQPLVGPLPASVGLSLVYQDSLGNTLPNPPNLNAIARVRVVVRANSQAKFNNQAQNDTDSTIVYLRNR